MLKIFILKSQGGITTEIYIFEISLMTFSYAKMQFYLGYKSHLLGYCLLYIIKKNKI